MKNSPWYLVVDTINPQKRPAGLILSLKVFCRSYLRAGLFPGFTVFFFHCSRFIRKTRVIKKIKGIGEKEGFFRFFTLGASSSDQHEFFGSAYATSISVSTWHWSWSPGCCNFNLDFLKLLLAYWQGPNELTK